MSKFPIPEAAFAQHAIALGKTRSGKSSKMRLVVEHLLDEKKPVCIIDPKGDWWGLKSSADGKTAGYAIIIFGGKHADVDINERSGAAVAELVSTGNRPCIIDLGGWRQKDRTQFFIDFAEAFFIHTRGTRWLAIDECHNFVPKGKVFSPDIGEMLHWGNRLASEGQGKGINLLSASQRPQKVHNDYLTSHETLIACRVTHKADRDAIKDWIDGCGDPVVGKEMIGTLAAMQRPEAWVWSPEIGFGPTRITFPLFGTYDSFKPQANDAPARLKGWSSVDLDEVKAQLVAVVEEMKANDPKALKAENARLNAELGKLRKSASSPSAPVANLNSEAALKDRERAFAAGDKQGFERGWPEGYLVGHQAGFEHGLGRMRQTVASLAPSLTAQYVPPDRAPKPPKIITENITAPAQTKPRSTEIPKAPARINAAPVTSGRVPTDQRVLDSLAELESMHVGQATREIVGFLSGYSNIQSPGFRNALAALKDACEIEYPMAGEVRLTESGRKRANTPISRSAEEIQARIVEMLGGATGRVLAHLISIHPGDTSRTELGAVSGYTNIQSPGFRDALAKLRTLGFVDYPTQGQVRAGDVLFLGSR